MTECIEHGHDLATPLFLTEDITRRADGLDSGTISFLARDREAFTVGSMLSAPYGGLRVMDFRRVVDGPAYEFYLAVEGVNGPKPTRRLKGFPNPVYSFTEWDRCEDAWITANPNQIVEGSIGGFGGSMVCVSVNPKPLGVGWYEVRAQYLGIMRAKPRQRSITVNGQTISSDSLTVNLPGGWTTPRKGVAQLPKIVVRDRYLGFNPPPTNLIPGNATPLNPPTINFITVNGTDVTQYWPAGWYLSSIASEQIGDKSIYAVDWIYEFQYPKTP